MAFTELEPDPLLLVVGHKDVGLEAATDETGCHQAVGLGHQTVILEAATETDEFTDSQTVGIVGLGRQTARLEDGTPSDGTGCVSCDRIHCCLSDGSLGISVLVCM